MIKIAICDDDEVSRAMLCRLILQYFINHNYEYDIYEAVDGEDIVAEYDDKNQFDIIFLDVILKKMNGIETARKIRSYSDDVRIVFMTVSPDYALESYDVFAFGYLLKPLDKEKLAMVMNRFLREEFPRENKSILIKSGTRQERIAYDDILYIESNNKILNVHTASGNVYRIYAKLPDVEKELVHPRFLRCHQSYIVNMDYIKSIDVDFTVQNGDHVAIRQKELKKMRDHYYDYINAKELK